MTLSIRWKVALGTLLAITLGLAAAGWLAFRSIEQLELAHAEEKLAARTGLTTLSLQPLLTKADTPPFRLQAMAHELSRHASARVTVIDQQGRVLADSDVPDDAVSNIENHGSRPEVAGALSTGHGTDLRPNQRRFFWMLFRLILYGLVGWLQGLASPPPSAKSARRGLAASRSKPCGFAK